MQVQYLTKSDFKVAQTCPTKLYYRKRGYPTTQDGDEELSALIDQGYMVEALARTLYPEGVWVGFREDTEAAAWDTMTALKESATLFEATFISGAMMARVDILARRGDVIELIEVKSRGFDRRKNDELVSRNLPNLLRKKNQPSAILAGWLPYIADAAFQTMVLQYVFPHLRVIPYLLMLDTSQPCPVDGLHRRFVLRFHRETGPSASPTVEYDGDPRDIRRNSFLVRVDVSTEVESLLPEVRQQADTYARSLVPSLRRLTTPISINCSTCEFRVADGDRRGFHECWGELANVTPHILDLYRVSDLGGKNNRLANHLIATGKAGLFDIPVRGITRGDGSVGEIARRQRLQVRCMRDNREWVDDRLGNILDEFTYPIHFIDFETCTPAIPRYQRMRPFDTVAFLWCCQTIHAPDGLPQHSEWLQAADTYPNATFAKTLRRQLGDQGSVLVWGSHETGVLKSIARQLAEREGEFAEIVAWINELTASDRIIDMNRLAFQYYFHPLMGGSTSLKKVCEAVWCADALIRARLPEFLLENDGDPTSPYAALPPLAINGRLLSIAEGSRAMMAYYSMIERQAAGATLEATRWRQLLQQYCRLDTLAMVMVWWRWRHLTGTRDK